MAHKQLGDGVIDVGFEADPEVDRLRDENRRLQRQVADAERETQRAREDADRALSMLRRQLSPLYRALQAVFGELDAAGVTDSDPETPGSNGAPAVDSRVRSVWDDWKGKLSPSCGRVIDALLIHGELSAAQLVVAAKMSTGTLHGGTGVLAKLNKAGLIMKNGGKFSLKKL